MTHDSSRHTVARPAHNDHDQPIAHSPGDVAAFWRWFGDSVLVDDHGRPRVFYHKTGSDFETFEDTNGQGFHFGTQSQANMRAVGQGANVRAVYLQAHKVARVNDQPHGWMRTIQSARKRGVDALVYLNRYEGIPAERFESLFNEGYTQNELDSMAEARFRQLVPEAQDSVVVLDARQIRPVFGPAPTEDRVHGAPAQATDEAIRAWAKRVEADLGLDSFSVWRRGDALTLHLLVVPKGARKQGKGTAAMQALTELADAHGLRIVCSPAVRDDHHGTTSRSRLVRFYKRFGFVENKGRNKDFSISEGLYRDPVRSVPVLTPRPRGRIGDF